VRSGKVQLNLVARYIPLRAKKLSLEKRLERFHNKRAVQVRAWYEPVARRLLVSASQGGAVGLVMDSSRLAFGYQLLMVAVCYHGRTQPLAWSWVAHRQGHSRTRLQVALLADVRTLWRSKVKVLLVGDSEFGRGLVIEHLKRWDWHSALRQAGDHLVMLHHRSTWQRLDSIEIKQGQWHFFEHVLLTQANACPTHWCIFWAKGEKQPW
jgi:hypothetical protein